MAKALFLHFLLLTALLGTPAFGEVLTDADGFYAGFSPARSVRKPGEARKSCWELFSAMPIPGQINRRAIAQLKVQRPVDLQRIRDRYLRLAGSSMNGQNNVTAEFLRFVRPADYANAPVWQHGVEVYGVQNYVAFTKADEYLKAIPKGKFSPTIEVLNEVDRLSSSAAQTTLKKLDPLIPDGYLADKGGVLKRRDVVGANPLRNPLTEEQYNALKANSWLKGFNELPYPFSRPGARRGWIHYASAESTASKLKELEDWYQLHKETMDPVELAARYQYALVSIHPFPDGNGRSSRLIMDRILAEHDLPPSILRDSDEDILVPVEEYVEEVRDGLERYLKILSKTGVTGKVPRNDRNGGLEITNLLADLTSDANSLKTFSFGEKRFALSLRDGFFYDAAGIPHVYRDGSLYPVADRTYRLLEMNVPMKKEKVERVIHHDPVLDANGNPVKDAQGNPVIPPDTIERTERDVIGESPDHLQYVTDNRQLLKAVSEGKIDPAQVKVAPYSVIDQANRSRELHLHPWQEPLLERALSVDEGKPAAQRLRLFRQGKTDFEKVSSAQKRPEHILAHYQLVDMFYADLEKEARERFPHLLAKAQQSREKLFNAARELLAESQRDFEALSPEAKKTVEAEPSFKLYKTYLDGTRLKYASYAEATKKVDDSMVWLMRSDSTAVNKIGFLSHTQFTQAFNALPGAHKLREMLEKLKVFLQSPDGKFRIKAMMRLIKRKSAKGEGIYAYLPESLRANIRDLEKIYGGLQEWVNYAVNTLFKHKYDMHSAGPEFERAFVMDLAHATGDGLKDTKSFTTNSNLMLNSIFGMTFHGQFEDQVSFVKVPRSHAFIQLGSDQYSNEYEILVDRPIAPWKISQSFLKKDIVASPLRGRSSDTRTSAESEAAAFLNRHFGTGF